MNTSRHDSLPKAGIKLLLAGAVTSIVAGLILVAIVWITTDSQTGLAAAIGAGMGVLAMGLGQAVLTGAWRLRGMTSLAVAMVAYAVGVAGVMLGMAWMDAESDLSLFWVGIGVVVAALAYIIAVALTYPKLRILLYQPEDLPPDPGAEEL